MESPHASPIPAPILATLAPVSVTAVVDGRARLTTHDSKETFSVPVDLLPRGVGVGAEVYIRALSAAAAADESDAIARKVLEQFLN